MRKPHAMYSLVNGDHSDDSHLLRGEILTIMKVITMFLGSDSYQGNNIFPVMVFSFMGTKGRILQAHFDKHGLSIHASELFDFSTASDAVRSTGVFLRYLCGRPKGKTVSNSQYLGKLNSSPKDYQTVWPLPNQ
ncbi:hypothetical protein BJX64DRAFT_268763 [Aspergillus heterothallicus]